MRRKLLIAATTALLLCNSGPAAADPDPHVLRVCADPNNLPLSDREGRGYENRIAQIIGEELGRSVEYTFQPQRMGFIRNTLRASDGHGGYKCDLIIGVPSDYEMTANTRPYLHSTWVMVLPDRPEFANVHAPEDVLALPADVRDKLRFGTFTHSPPLDWVFENGLFSQTIVHKALSADPDEVPGQIVSQDLASGKIDVAMVWGPIGGYFAKQANSGMRVLPFTTTEKIRYDYLLAMGVRVPDKQWRATIDGVIAKRQADIDRILREYSVPMLDLPPQKPADGGEH